MKAKLIACMLGMSIVFTTGTVIPAETDEASAGFVVENTAVEQPPAEPAAPAPEPAPAPDAGTENTVAPESGSTDPAADTGSTQNTDGNDPQNTGSEDNSGSGNAAAGNDPVSSEGGTSDGSAAGDVSTDDSAAAVSETGSDSSSVSTADSGLTEETSKSVSSDSLETGSEEDKEEDDEEEKKEQIVVGFKGVAKIVLKEKKPLNEVLAMLPSVVEAVLSDGTTLHVPVDWACTSDYGDEKAEKFVFASSLKKNADGTVYDIGHPVAPGVSFPTVEVVIGTGEEEEKEPKNDRKEPTDNKVEDAPLVMDDVTAANISAAEGEEEIFEYLIRELDLNKAAACGVLANIHYESGFNPHAIGDGGTSYGICQWHLGRYFSLVDYCGRIHLPYGSVEGQMKYLEYELTGGYAGVLDYLHQVPETEIGAYEAGYYWCYHFERPAQILRQSTLRGNAAKNSYWPRYKDYNTTDPGVEKKEQKKLLLKELQAFESLDGRKEVIDADTADTELAVAPLNREAEPATEIRKEDRKQETEEKQEEAARRLKEEERVRRKKEEALAKRDMADAAAAETVIQEETESVPEAADQEEHTWDVLKPVEEESRYFLPTRREDSLDSETFMLDY